MKLEMNKSTMLLTLGFIICLSGCILFAYLWIDQSISRAYLDESYEISIGFKRVSSLLETEWAGISEQDLLDKLKALSHHHPNDNIVIFKDDESNSIVVDTIEFKIEAGKFKQIIGCRLSKLDRRPK